MPATATPPASPAPDPLAPLAEAIGSMLADVANPQAASAGGWSFQLTGALHQVLEAATPQSHRVRLLLMRHLVDIESRAAGIEVPATPAPVHDFISTAQAAEILGYSRPYVAMLIDQNQLQGATVSAGGHRRVPRAAVLEWKNQHQGPAKVADLRAQGQKIGAYKSAEADAVRRVKALAADRQPRP